MIVATNMDTYAHMHVPLHPTCNITTWKKTSKKKKKEKKRVYKEMKVIIRKTNNPIKNGLQILTENSQKSKHKC